MVAGAGAGDVEEVALGGVDFLEGGLVGGFEEAALGGEDLVRRRP